jgi:hypothetical protein
VSSKAPTKPSANQDNWQTFNNDNWDTDDTKKLERDERNAQKLKEQASKRQSKPLKLGAKKLTD